MFTVSNIIIFIIIIISSPCESIVRRLRFNSDLMLNRLILSLFYKKVFHNLDAAIKYWVWQTGWRKPYLINSNYNFEIFNHHWASGVINAQTFSMREEAFGQQWSLKGWWCDVKCHKNHYFFEKINTDFTVKQFVRHCYMNISNKKQILDPVAIYTFNSINLNSFFSSVSII